MKYHSALLGDFAADFMDRGARVGSRASPLSDLWFFLTTLSCGATVSVDALEKTLVRQFGLPLVFVPAVIAAIGATACGYAITAKRDAEATGVVLPGNTSSQVYRHSRPVRWFAKCGFLVLLALCATKTVRAIEDLQPIPRRFAGYLIDSRTGTGIPEARVRVVAANGKDITKAGQLVTDNEGVYIVEATEAVPRTADLVASVAGCEQELKLPLRRADETPERPSGTGVEVAFRHTIQCGSKK